MSSSAAVWPCTALWTVSISARCIGAQTDTWNNEEDSVHEKAHPYLRRTGLCGRISSKARHSRADLPRWLLPIAARPFLCNKRQAIEQNAHGWRLLYASIPLRDTYRQHLTTPFQYQDAMPYHNAQSSGQLAINLPPLEIKYITE